MGADPSNYQVNVTTEDIIKLDAVGDFNITGGAAPMISWNPIAQNVDRYELRFFNLLSDGAVNFEDALFVSCPLDTTPCIPVIFSLAVIP